MTRNAIAEATSSAVPMRLLGIAAIADVPHRVAERSGHLGLDEARGHGVDRDVPARNFAGERLGEPDQPGLRRRVVGLPRVADHPRDAGDVDDAAESLAEHGPERGAADVERGGQIDCDHRVPVVIAEAHRQVVPVDPRIVHHDVEPTERL